MKKNILILIVLFSAITLHAQNEGVLSKKEQRKLLKEERRRISMVQEELKIQQVEHMVKSATFVLEANTIFDKYGTPHQVTPSINFILVDSLYGVIQVGTNMGLGQNGVGGVTVEGTINNYELNFNEKKHNYDLNFNVKGFTGSYSVFMNISENGHAEARVGGTYSGSIRYSGNLVHPSVSKVYKGNSR